MPNRAAALILSAFAVVSFAATAGSQTQPKPLTVEAIYGGSSIVGQPPANLTWSPDGKHLTYLDDGQLIEVDAATAQGHVLVSREKMAALTGSSGTEQDRDHRSRYNMASYLWAPDGRHLLFDSGGRLWYFDIQSGTGVNVADSGAASGDDPKFSPDGRSISYLRDRGIHVVALGPNGAQGKLTPAAGSSSGNQVILNGAVDWVYAEELDVRSNYFWAPDSQHIAFLQVDETAVPVYPIEDWIPTHATVDEQRYPQPGDRNPDVHLGVSGTKGGKTIWIRLPFKPGDDYVPRFGWADKSTLWVETLSRDHTHRAIYFSDIASGRSLKMVEMVDEKFVDDSYDVVVDSGSIVYTNWASGNVHLYRYTYDVNHPLDSAATFDRQLTTGNFDVTGIERVDAKERRVYYTSNEGNVLEEQLWQVGFDGERKQLTAAGCSHQVNFAPIGEAFVDRVSTRMSPPILNLCTEPAHCSVFWKARALDSYHLRAPVQLETKAHDGSTLYYTLLLPEDKSAAATVPLIVNPYGGPGPQGVRNRWSDSLLFDELLAQHGFAVLHADSRGSGGRGRNFAQAAYRNFGPVQLEDMLTVVDSALAQYGQLDPKRLGWWGWSWGGTFTLYAMTHSDRFRAGVAVAAVTDWRNYDSIYTERYLGLPAENAAAYRDDSVVNAAAKLKGRILLVHGTGDDNVHMGNSVQFIQKLIEAKIPYDLQIYPRKTHSIAGADVRTHLYTRILAHFEQNLMKAE